MWRDKPLYYFDLWYFYNMVPKAGVEPAQPCDYQTLNLARLPVPPLRQIRTILSYFTVILQLLKHGLSLAWLFTPDKSKTLKGLKAPLMFVMLTFILTLQDYLSGLLWFLRQQPLGLPSRQGRLTQGCLLCRASRQVLCSHQ